MCFGDFFGILYKMPVDIFDCQYMIGNNAVPVTINDKLSSEINGIVRKVIRLNKRGVRIILSNINYILNELNKTK